MKDNEKWLLVANGEKLSAKRLKSLAQGRQVIACDGGLDSCIDIGIPVQKLLGDFDSLKSNIPESCEVIAAPDQDKTDSEKALIHLITLEKKDIIICQALGDRLDHSLINLSLLSKYHKKINQLSIAREHEVIFFARDETIQLSGKPGSGVAVMGFNAANITSHGLKYECEKTDLKANEYHSGCNSLQSGDATIHVIGEALVSQQLPSSD